MKQFFTNMAIKYLQKEDFIILNRSEIEKDKFLFKIAAQFLSHINRYNKSALVTKNN